MRDNQLPRAVLALLRKKGIRKHMILDVCPFDMTEKGEYASGYLFLTEKYVGILTSQPENGRIRYFKGTEVSGTTYALENREYACKLLDVNKCEKMKLERQVVTNVVSIFHEGIQLRIAVLTNLYLAQMIQFVKSFGKLKKYPGHADEIEASAEIVEEEEEFCPICGTKYPDPKRKVCPKCTNKKSIFGRTLGLFLKYRVRIAFVVFCYILESLFSIIWPYLSGTVLYDWILKKDNTILAKFGFEGKYYAALSALVIFAIGFTVVQKAVDVLQRKVMIKLTTTVVSDIKQKVFEKLESLSLGFFTSKQTGGLMTRILSDASRVSEFFVDGFPNIFIQGFTIISSFTVMFMLNWKMASVACVLIPLLVYISVMLKPKLWTLFGKRHRAERSLTSRVNDNITGARVVKAFGQQRNEIDRFESPNSRLKEAEVHIVQYNNKFTILFNFVQEISSIWVWIMGVLLLLRTNTIEIGVLITFVGYVAQLNGPMNFFSRVMHMWSDSINASQRIFEIIDAIPDIQEIDNPLKLENPRGKIELRDVTFGYDVNKPILKNLNIEIKEGEMLGIVGRSGAGKTTLVNLISRLYDPNEGEILIDDKNVKDLAFYDLRRNVATVSQDTYMFMGTIADNIAYAKPDATSDEIIRAAKLASAHDFISRMPDGYDTIIGASGKDLSGGEKQRLSIARAILANPKILILDEATASVDTETERAIQQSINYLINGRTTISIAHRLSTLRDADRIIVIENGRIAEEGTGRELDRQGGIYHKLMELQTKSMALEM